jgi:hypothetical protein
MFGTSFAGEQCSASILPSLCKGEGKGEGNEEEREPLSFLSLHLDLLPSEEKEPIGAPV